VTNAQKHVDALLARFGEPPFEIAAVSCSCLEMSADGNTIMARVEWGPGHVDLWVVPEPEVLVLDPAGDIAVDMPEVNEDGEPTGGTVTVRFSEDPLAVATAELASFLRAVRG